MYCAYVTRIHNLRKHTNADRLLCGECFGNTVIVDLGTDPDQLGVYFPTDGKLGLEFAQKNDLLRRKDENGAPAGGYLDPEKRNIKALKLRGEKSDGLFLPLSCLASFTDIKKLQEGDTISVLNGITICEKYVPAVKRSSGSGGGGNRVRKRSDPISPLFQEHADTEQLAYNLSAFHAGDLVEVTLKMHGTSQRTGYLPVLQGYKYRNGMEKRLYESRKTPNVIRSKIKRTPIYDWGYVTGTRRVVLDTFDEGGYYGNNAFREKHAFVLNAKPLSTTHIMENDEHVDFKDIRLMFDCIKKQNVNFVEILFTPYSIINPEYADLFQPVLDAREEIARYNNYAGMNCIMGMALEKQKAMEHPYPATMDKIEAFGYDPKQLHHALRLREFMTRYEAGEPYADCLISNQCDYLKEVKRGCYSLEEARALMSTAIQSMTEDKKRYMDTVPVSINQHANEVLQKATVEILKRSFLKEIQGGE